HFTMFHHRATSDALKNEIKNIDIEEEITHNLEGAPRSVLQFWQCQEIMSRNLLRILFRETEDIKQETVYYFDVRLKVYGVRSKKFHSFCMTQSAPASL
ncbi:hypothetical protein L9F63_026836, partial [Diploptera punctata]